MIHRVLFALTFAGIGALAYGWWYNNQRIISTQQAQIEKFINAGPRFTAKDGQMLCKRVQELENLSYGFRATGKEPLACTYFVEDSKK